MVCDRTPNANEIAILSIACKLQPNCRWMLMKMLIVTNKNKRFKVICCVLLANTERHFKGCLWGCGILKDAYEDVYEDVYEDAYCSQ